jgi:DNA (cytosine-5)-methyltransferase 1
MSKKKPLKFIDLFAGLGGTRIGLENAAKKIGMETECVFTSEIKPSAIQSYKKNFGDEKIHGDITKISASEIPDFDLLVAGFPCQPFSSAGARRGFLDTRGTLFFDIERILKEKNPRAILLENVEGLKTHDRIDFKKPIGRTLETILSILEKLGYKVSWQILDASKHGIPQKRKRIYIVGTKSTEVDITNLPVTNSKLIDILEKRTDHKYLETELVTKLLKGRSIEDLWGKQIKDKRGGANNIHSWDIGLKGKINTTQRILLEELLKQRRRKSWAASKGIPWSDGMPLTLREIETFYFKPQSLFAKKKPDYKKRAELEALLDDLVEKGYLVKERPKNAPDWYTEEGYNIVVGKLSFDISHILHPEKHTPALVATDVTRLAVPDAKGLRRLTVREGLRLFGFPERYQLEGVVDYNSAFDLLGNSVCINTVELVSERLLKAL